MKTAIAVFCAGLFLAPAALAQEPPIAATVKERCQLCHMDEDDSAPALKTVKTFAPEEILDKLNNGTMVPMAAGLSEDQKKQIAEYLSGKPLPK